MATYGKVSEFNRSSEDWSDYIERVEFYFAANGIADVDGQPPKRKAVLLSLVGAETYKLIKTLLAPEYDCFEDV